jgi:hypothetical protein
MNNHRHPHRMTFNFQRAINMHPHNNNSTNNTNNNNNNNNNNNTLIS